MLKIPVDKEEILPLGLKQLYNISKEIAIEKIKENQLSVMLKETIQYRLG